MSDSYILNMANNTMSIRPEEPEHFAEFLLQDKTLDEAEKNPGGFARRSVFGAYLQKHLLTVIQKGAAYGMPVSVRPHCEVLDVQVSDGSYRRGDCRVGNRPKHGFGR